MNMSELFYRVFEREHWKSQLFYFTKILSENVFKKYVVTSLSYWAQDSLASPAFFRLTWRWELRASVFLLRCINTGSEWRLRMENR